MDIVREITPLTQNDCFTVFSREKTEFNFPLHNHEDMEVNLILNAAGAQRIVGDHIGELDDSELVCVGPNLAHGWFTHHCKSKFIKEVTIQFHKDLFDERFLSRNELVNIRNMFENSKRGLMFQKAAIESIAPRILALEHKNGFDSILELLSIINDMSLYRDVRLLSDLSFTVDQFNSNSRRIENVFKFMNTNFSKQITLGDVAAIAHMTKTSFSRFIKQRTGFSFVESRDEIRLGHVSKMLIDTSNSVAEIAFKCGFNNMANFNRLFKSKKGLTPKEFRENYVGKRIFV